MNTPHKYAKEITHWANGGEIQVLNTSQIDPVWLDMEGDKLPKFNAKHLKWRIKQKTIELDMEDGFVRWIPDDKWIEVEV